MALKSQTTHFYHLWPLGQKNDIQIFYRRSGYKIIKRLIFSDVYVVTLTILLCNA